VASYDSLLDVLGDRTRRAVFERVARRPQSVGELTAQLGAVSRPAVSQHLKLLADAGLVEFERVGTRNVYRATPEGLKPLQRYLDTISGEAVLAVKRASMTTGRSRAKRS